MERIISMELTVMIVVTWGIIALFWFLAVVLFDMESKVTAETVAVSLLWPLSALVLFTKWAKRTIG